MFNKKNSFFDDAIFANENMSRSKKKVLFILVLHA